LCQENCTAIDENVKKIENSIHVGFRWLTKLIESNWEELSKRVARDVEMKEEREKREKQERVERVQRTRELRYE